MNKEKEERICTNFFIFFLFFSPFLTFSLSIDSTIPLPLLFSSLI
jgi:hypothetical protein